MTKRDQKKETQPFNTDKERSIDTASENFSDLDTGWAWVVLFASFGTFCLLGGKMYAVGIIHSALLERYSKSVSLTSWAGALHTALFSLGGPLSSAVIDRFSCRTALMLSGVFFIAGYIGTAFADTIEMAIFTCGILAGTGGALGYTTAMVVVSFNFKRRRNLALGIAVSGVGAGVFILSPLMQLSRDYYGPVGFFIILAAMAANVITFGAMCFPSKLEMHTKRQRQFKSLRSRGKQSCCTSFKLYIHILFNKAVFCLCACMFCYCLGTNLMYLYLPSFIVSKGFTALEASFLVSLSGILSVFGRLLTGFAANLSRINDIYLFSGSMGIVTIACFIYLLISGHFAGHVIFVSLFGLFFGSSYVIITSVTLPFVGINYISAAIGLEFFFGGVGSIIGPVFAGFLVDVSGTYDQSIIVAASCILFSTISSAVTACFNQKSDDFLQKEETVAVVDNQIKEKQSME
ncbi:monocarboxylate transporter 12-B-like isoform X1 [Mercenaria mercenaria]|uniref:monocarboxylate transporter 12-B-like isoform X1 n=1 Tax=Mercenaria mercenaria TaxID=6596 RepID=UPI00234F6593|nr:monocarboxylate transporter 12-B-like isoform X1 [Mercenaria mercenaria]XP_045188863.2 monocarboxylate transporter 12-B-like isoform X1 [Mercenaria mercenaria]XP_045188864.2 monocarboxylate transporter 12-B-like isoform X1 [Mercenaria mercenaria]XP_045188865.2 monocarboxylate transporter 12-B-like isoform X1 [Mercenaria mercenaria]XP_053406858.1 monocarboxylate transporter 12-B-like isoform X1 [Mercenaria mercenaria]XP_053406859.1 monocarboxylate transporter 12-B-like isoform X1 [Mercenaria